MKRRPTWRALFTFILGIACLGVVIVCVSRATQPRRSVITDIFTLRDNRFLAFWEVENRTASLLELMDLERGSLWSRLIPGFPIALVQGRLALDTNDTLVVQLAPVVAVSDTEVTRRAFTLGLNVTDGSERWRDDPLPGEVDETGFLPISTRLLATDQRIYEFRERLGQLSLLIARVPRTGREIWRYERRQGVTAVGPVWLVAGLLIVNDLDFILFMDPDSGQVLRRTPLLGTRPCVVDNFLFYSRDGELRAVSLPDLDERRIELELESMTREQTERFLLFHGYCGRYGDRILLGLDRTLVALDAEELEQQWQLDIDVARFERVSSVTDIADGQPHSIPFSGELTRYVPIFLRTEREVLALFDVHEGDLLWLSETDSLAESHLLRLGDLYYFIYHRDPTIAVLDGTTGQWLAGRRFPGLHNGQGHLMPRHFLGDSIVLFGGDEWLTVDGRTLLRQQGSGMSTGEDVLEQILRELAIPRTVSEVPAHHPANNSEGSVES